MIDVAAYPKNVVEIYEQLTAVDEPVNAELIAVWRNPRKAKMAKTEKIGSGHMGDCKPGSSKPGAGKVDGGLPKGTK